ncbi:SUF system Fe-S cluster assembly regulator [Kordiimonas sediminis]|uniref:SUF system Fe-S cluster assembly regulator n=1 Tax=Kordiimonas sediminis TaxID=1735581 RepID=A0A919AL09_9PROT|nr:SUF system Fe-S cluster assembly regulator [Kordiimonas sediminis]GHF12958.1 SUF system Fe-S cluster assembly regulator [Kordiimonas sediminis]
MIKLTNLADYAVILMVDIARLDRKISAQELSRQSGLPLPTVSKILNALGRAGLLESHRGLKGGFCLAKSRDDISVASIIEAVDGPIALTHCVDGTEEACTVSSICHMKPHWAMINDTVRSALDTVKLSEICNTDAMSPFAIEPHRGQRQATI